MPFEVKRSLLDGLEEDAAYDTPCVGSCAGGKWLVK